MTQDEAIAECRKRYEADCKELWDAAETFVRTFNFPTAASIVNDDSGLAVMWSLDEKSCLATIGRDWTTYESGLYATVAFHRGNDQGLTNEWELTKFDYAGMREWLGIA